MDSPIKVAVQICEMTPDFITRHSVVNLTVDTNPLTPTVDIWVVWVQLKHPVPDRVKQSFVIFNIRALWRSGLSIRVPGYQK